MVSFLPSVKVPLRYDLLIYKVVCGGKMRKRERALRTGRFQRRESKMIKTGMKRKRFPIHWYFCSVQIIK